MGLKQECCYKEIIFSISHIIKCEDNYVKVTHIIVTFLNIYEINIYEILWVMFDKREDCVLPNHYHINIIVYNCNLIFKNRFNLN